MDNWLELLNMMPVNFYLDRHGDTIENRIVFYKTFLNQSDNVIKLFKNEKEYGLKTTISYDDYTELLLIRKEVIEQIQNLNKRLNRRMK